MKLSHLATAAVLLFSAGLLSAADLAIKSGDKLAFLGDSITQYGNNYPCGYLHLVIDGLKRSGVNVTMIPAGISGHKSNQMLARVENDVIKKKATWMTISCGVNDVWHGARGVELEAYKKNITALCDKVDKAGIKIMVLTATMIYEDAKNPNNVKLAAYNDFLRSFAKERKYVLVDLNDMMQKGVAAAKAADKKPGKKNYLTRDGVHMAKAGNIMMASGILAGFGVPAADIQKYAKEWSTWPDTTRLNVEFTVTEWQKLEKAAKAQKKNVNTYSKALILNSVK